LESVGEESDQIVDIRKNFLTEVNDSIEPQFSLATTLGASKILTEVPTPSLKAELYSQYKLESQNQSIFKNGNQSENSDIEPRQVPPQKQAPSKLAETNRFNTMQRLISGPRIL